MLNVVFPYISPWGIFPLDWGDVGGKEGREGRVREEEKGVDGQRVE